MSAQSFQNIDLDDIQNVIRDQYFKAEMDGKPIFLQVQIKAVAPTVTTERSPDMQPAIQPHLDTEAPVHTWTAPVIGDESLDRLDAQGNDPMGGFSILSDSLFDNGMEQNDPLGDINVDLPVGAFYRAQMADEDYLGLLQGTNTKAPLEIERFSLPDLHSVPVSMFSETKDANHKGTANSTPFREVLLGDSLKLSAGATRANENANKDTETAPAVKKQPHGHFKTASSFDVVVEHEVQVTPTANDVILGRGGLSNNHLGNKKFHGKKQELQPKYIASPRNEKKQVAKELVEWVWNNGGRFLQKTGRTGQWEEAPLHKVLLKCSQALRTLK